jgi:formylglycine-generating enzyme required for sulfatase activity
MKGNLMACAELEFGISAIDEQRFSLRARYWEPGSAVENNLGLEAGLNLTFDFPLLNSLTLSPERYGRALAEQFFASPAAWNAFMRARTASAARQAALRLRLYIEPAAAALQGLRWEMLQDLERRSWLATDENILFSRFLSSGSYTAFEPAVLGRMRGLVFIANPSDLVEYGLDPIDVAGELQRGAAGLSGIEMKSVAGEGAATPQALLENLREGCDVLYLVAHGAILKGKPLLYLENPAGGTQVVTVADLVNQLSELRRLPLLAVLISCQSAGGGEGPREDYVLTLGTRLAGCGVPAVLAMQGKITFPTLAEFMPVFFRELQTDGSIDRAIAVARGHVRNRLDWWMPVLFSRLRDNQLFLPDPAALPVALHPYEPETVYIPAGKFCMGRDPAPGVPAWETPSHAVDLPAYRIGKFPVTNRQFAEYIRQSGEAVTPEMGWAGQSPDAGCLDRPVTGVTWYQAVSYCDWLSRKTGRRYRLPDEAQWEKAARGKAGGLYPWGDAWQEGRCNPDPNRTTPVDEYPAQSSYGCFDLVGNAREWTLSLWGEKRSELDPRFAYPWRDDGRNDPGANPLIRRIYRGGAADDPAGMACTARSGYAPDKAGPPGKRHGFRVVMTLANTPQ